MENRLECLKTIFYRERDRKHYESVCKTRAFVSVVLCLAAMAMLIMNLKNHSMVMAYSSIVLVIGFLMSSVAAGICKKADISGVIIALLVGFVLSLFAVTGGNQGFAILWILLVPMFATSLLGMVPGLLVSTYFLVFLMGLFYSPLRESMADKYTQAFISRFPILYLCDYAIATYFSIQKEYYHKQLEYQAYYDSLTGLYNRRSFMEHLHNLEMKSGYALIMIDLNGLKLVNDEFGHEAGDEFLCKVSDLFQKEFEKNAKVYRLGGDELAIIVSERCAGLETMIQRVKEQAYALNETLNYEISFAVGMADSLDNKGVSPEELLKIADKNMYLSKMEYYRDARHNRRKR